MRPRPGLRARRAVSLASALCLVAATAAVTAAQDEPAPPTPDATTSTGAAELTVGPWRRAAIDDAPEGFFIRGVTSTPLGTLALGNQEFEGLRAAAWFSEDGLSWRRATFAPDAPRGLVEAAVATPGGWVAVGRDFPEAARAWTSVDGLHWDGVTDIEAADEHILYDVAVTPVGLVAVGCESENHCKVGKAWRSDDGTSWELLSELPIQLPNAIDVVDGTIVVAGWSDGFEPARSDAVVAHSRDGREWTLDDPLARRDAGFRDLALRGDELLVAGYKRADRPAKDQTRIYRSADGETWKRVAAPELKGWTGFDLSVNDDLVLVLGSRVTGEGPVPVTYATSDLREWREGTFADTHPLAIEQVFETAFTADGSLALLVGVTGNRPTIWYAPVGPVGSPQVASAEPVQLAKPSRFEMATVPDGAIGQSIRDVIPGGPGLIAVGGGSDTGTDLQALAWTSADGITWQPATLAQDATNGVIMAATQLPAGGYLGVGYEFMPKGFPEDTIVNALAWHSDDGLTWTRVPADGSFPQSIMYDATATDDGVVVVGCLADFHCREGRVWSSGDGLVFDLSATLPIALFAVAADGEVVVSGGIDDAVLLDAGQAVLASRVDGTWRLSDRLAGVKSQITGLTAVDGGFVAVGVQSPQDTDKPVESAIITSPDGIEWQIITHRQLRRLSAAFVAARPDLIAAVGSSFDPETGTTPYGVWTRDLATFRKVRFADVPDGSDLSIGAGGMAEDGSLLLAAGHLDYRPMIWYSAIE